MRIRPLIQLVVVLAGAALSLALLLHFDPQVWGRSSPRVEQAKASSALPTRLIIPKIAVDAAVEDVGLAPDGALDAPKGPDDVAWYQLGPRPGEIGSAVIDGHSGWKDGRAAAFDDLYKLHAGDTISVEYGDGTTTSFVVREVRTYDPTADTSSVFISNDGKSHLNLITCEGVWDPISRSYSGRLVVFSDEE